MTPNADGTAWTITLRPNVEFHDGTPCNGAALAANFKAHQALAAHRARADPDSSPIALTSPLAVTITMKSPWVPFPYYLAGGIGSQFAYVAAPSMLAGPNGSPTQPGRHRALRLPGVGPQRPLHRHGQPQLLAHGHARTSTDHLQADPRRRGPARGPQVRHHRHHDHRHRPRSSPQFRGNK